MYIGLHVKYLYFCPILINIEFSRKVLKNTQIRNLIKIRLVRAELFQEETRRRDMRKLTFAIINFANAPKNLNI
jgi:hypothetical protein